MSTKKSPRLPFLLIIFISIHSLFSRKTGGKTEKYYRPTHFTVIVTPASTRRSTHSPTRTTLQ